MRLLIVDDEPLVRRSLERIFAKEGFEVQSAEDGIAGLKMWQEIGPDVVLLDVLMPGLTGPQVLQKIYPHKAKVILMSAYSGEYELESLRHLGVIDFISKPFGDVFEVVKRIKERIRNP
ncbi:MAG: response regulator [Bdellovibrionaceae bacterium]|nr:response regulator [Pseudobdellovibrionaceae bacterium]